MFSIFLNIPSNKFNPDISFFLEYQTTSTYKLQNCLTAEKLSKSYRNFINPIKYLFFLMDILGGCPAPPPQKKPHRNTSTMYHNSLGIIFFAIENLIFTDFKIVQFVLDFVKILSEMFSHWKLVLFWNSWVVWKAGKWNLAGLSKTRVIVMERVNELSPFEFSTRCYPSVIKLTEVVFMC